MEVEELEFVKGARKVQGRNRAIAQGETSDMSRITDSMIYSRASSDSIIMIYFLRAYISLFSPPRLGSISTLP